MLTLRPQQKIVEKIVTTRDGGRARVIFAVIETAGDIQFKVLKVIRIVAAIKGSAILALPGNVIAAASISTARAFETLVSPYLPLFFFDSQPTRAPNFVN